MASDVSVWSPEFFRIIGLSPSTTSASLATFARHVHPDDRPLLDSEVARVLREGVADPLGLRLVRGDGTVREICVTSMAIGGPDGTPVRVSGALVDLTDVRESERDFHRREDNFKRAQRIAKFGTFEWEPSRGVVRWSDEFYRIWGMPRDTEPSIEAYLERVHPDDRKRLELLTEDAAAGNPMLAFEHRVIHPDGRIIDIHAEATTAKNAQTGELLVVGSALDITERKRFEVELRHSQKMDALGQLAGGIAHEFNNLLTVIGGHVDLLRRLDDAPAFGDIATAVQRARQLTRSLLAFSRQAPLEDKRSDAAQSVRMAVSTLVPMVGKNVAIQLDAPECAGEVALDASDFEQVLMNLVMNARDALPDGGTVQVRVEDAEVDAIIKESSPPVMPGSYVCVDVRDDGRGMSDSVRASALEPFFTTKPPGQGTGLGLSMAFSIVRQVGGGISIESTEGVGTTVRLYLPRLAPPAPALRPSAPPQLSCPPPSGTLLVVDDDPSLRTVLGLLLETEGFRVHVTDSAASALAYYEAHAAEIAAVVTDVVMPDMGGVELVRRLRALSPSLPALYLSGYAKPGAYDDDPSVRGAFLMKPFQPALLAERVRELLDQAASTRTSPDIDATP